MNSTKKRTYDAIVIGSGISGGWAAKELCEKGLKTLVLERGRDVKHIEDYPTARRLGNWKVGMLMMGETIPKASNFLALDKQQLDPFGMPKLKMSIDYDDNDEKMIKDFFEQSEAMFSTAGFSNFKTSDSHQAPGLDIHEMGGVRMGKDPNTSLLNAWNQLHACKNVFVTDGACMTSTSTQNPSLTYMALTARAADFAVKELKAARL